MGSRTLPDGRGERCPTRSLRYWGEQTYVLPSVLRFELTGEVLLGRTSPNCIASNEPTQARLLPRSGHAGEPRLTYTSRARGAKRVRACSTLARSVVPVVLSSRVVRSFKP